MNASLRKSRNGGMAALVIAVTLCSAPCTRASAQAVPPPTDGPVITGYGAAWDIPGPDLPTPVDQDLRVVFEVGQSAEIRGDVDDGLNTVARFLNMHARAGVPLDRMHLAVVIHGSASPDVLNADVFKARFGRENKNEDLLHQLARAGVELYLCGQSATSRSVARADVIPEVKLALSAMTAMVVLKGRGFVTVN